MKLPRLRRFHHELCDHFEPPFASSFNDATRKIGELASLCYCEPGKPNQFRGEHLSQEGRRDASEPLLERGAAVGLTSDPLTLNGDMLRKGCAKKLPLIWVTGVDCRLAGPGGLGDLVDARALESMLKKDPPGRIEDAFFNFSGELFRRPAGTRAPLCSRAFLFSSGRRHLVHLPPTAWNAPSEVLIPVASGSNRTFLR